MPLALACVFGLALAEARAATTEFEGCMDTVQLSQLMTLSDPSLLASIEYNASPASWLDLLVETRLDEAEGGDDVFFLHGMSCDGPSSCAPNLVDAVTARAEAAARDKNPGKDAPRGPMCSSLDPSDCNLEPVPAPTRAQLQLSQPLVPFLRDLDPWAPAPDQDDALDLDAQRRNPREQSLFSRSLVRRLERPPAA